MQDSAITPVAGTFPARLAELRQIGTFLNDFCTRQGVGREPCLRLHLVVEELFTNTVRHGHRGDSEAPVWVTLSAEPEALRVTYEDTAPPFNPYAILGSAPDTTLSLRKVGGLGVLLTQQLAAARDYTYLYGRNRIKLALKRSPSRGGCARSPGTRACRNRTPRRAAAGRRRCSAH
jgi:serine/threonine-protein kinase RsbW